MLQVDSKWTALTEVSREKLEQESINYTGAPEGYALSGDYILFGPIPDQAYSYRLPYYKRTGGIEDTIVTVTNRWILEAQEYTTFSTLVKMGRHHIQSPELTQRFVASRNEAEGCLYPYVQRARAGEHESSIRGLNRAIRRSSRHMGTGFFLAAREAIKFARAMTISVKSSVRLSIPFRTLQSGLPRRMSNSTRWAGFQVLCRNG